MMALDQSYEASPLKRHRASKVEIQTRRDALFEIVKAMQPMTVRQVFYQASVRNLVEKSESGYNKVQIALVQMRRNGTLPYGWLADSTRWQRKPRTFNSVHEALENTAALYRKSLWANADSRVEIWLEKDALAGVVYPITALCDVPLMVSRGYASLSFLHDAAEEMSQADKPTHIFHFGDYDPSGVNAGEKIEQTLKEMAPDAEIHFERVAVTLEQIKGWKLPTRPTKTSDSRSKGFGDISVELDAFEPDMLRDMVRFAIEQHLPARELKVLKEAERSERELIKGLVGMMNGGAA